MWLGNCVVVCLGNLTVLDMTPLGLLGRNCLEYKACPGKVCR